MGDNDPQEAFRCTGSSEVKMSVCGGGVYAVLKGEREGYSSKVRWKKYAGIRTCQKSVEVEHGRLLK